MIIREEDIEAFALQNTPQGEAPLVGVYGSLINSGAYKTGLSSAVITGSPLSVGVAAAVRNYWSMIFANSNRIVFGELGYLTADTKRISTILRRDIATIKVKRRIINYVVTVQLVDGAKIKFTYSCFGVLGHKNHRARAQQLTALLSK
jgi:hypothetical protein